MAVVLERTKGTASTTGQREQYSTATATATVPDGQAGISALAPRCQRYIKRLEYLMKFLHSFSGRRVGLWAMALPALGALMACSHLPQSLQPGRQLAAPEVRQLFAGQTVTSKNLSNGVVSVSRYAPHGQVFQQREGVQRQGTWRIEQDGRMCLKMESQTQSCRWIRLESDGRYQKYKETHAFAKPVVTYLDLGGTQTQSLQPGPDVTAVRSGMPDKDQIAGVQQKLNRAGFQAGPVDGLWGRATLTAWHRFQLQEGLPRTNRMDKLTLQRLSQAPDRSGR